VLAGVRVVELTDRANDIPPLLDRLRASGWDWVIHVTAHSKLVWRGPAAPNPRRVPWLPPS
jgi:hypothetical protein